MPEEIKTFVVVDLETNGLPSEQFNKCSITELSLYAFSTKCLADTDVNKQMQRSVFGEGVEGFDPLPPELPRVLHKLTLMVNPRRMINPSAELATGLSNEMLEYESPFDENTATCLNLFLERLEQPVCLVAHNGWSFDYPIIRYVYEHLKMSLPLNTYCVDSLKAFRELDEKFEEIEKNKKVFTALEAHEKDLVDKKDLQIIEQLPSTKTMDVLNTTISDPLVQNSKINWKLSNETTPQRKSKTLPNDVQNFNLADTNSLEKRRSVSLSVRRSLFADDFKPKTKHPPKGVYKLGKIYKRCFNRNPLNLHRAEADVEILTKLILHYGLDFLAYAEERKQLFTEVPKLGSPN